MSEAVKIRLPNGKEITLEDWSDKPLYSTCDILTGATMQEMNLFTYIEGEPVPAFVPAGAVMNQCTSTMRDTNMATAGAMASSEEFMVYSIRPEVFRLHVSDAASPDFQTPATLALGEPNPTPVMLGVLAQHLLMSLEISQKVYAQAGFGYYNFGGGIWGIGSAETGTAAVGQKGEPGNEAVRTYSIPQHIGGQEKFRVMLTNPPGTAIPIGATDSTASNALSTTRFARIRVSLDGLYKRPTA